MMIWGYPDFRKPPYGALTNQKDGFKQQRLVILWDSNGILFRQNDDFMGFKWDSATNKTNLD